MKPLEIDGVTIIIDAEPDRCADCGSAGPALVTFARLDGAGSVALCGVCARTVLPSPVRAESVPASRAGRKRTRQAGG